MRRRILAMTLAFLLTGISLPAQPSGTSVLGVVTQATAAHFNASKVSVGATIYDGDRLSTESEGLLQFRGAGALLYLPGLSGVTLHGLANGTQVQLRTGSLVFSTSKAAAMEVLADEAFIRPAADGPTVAQITIVGPKELQITARRGALNFSYRNETEKIAEGTACRILLDSPEAAPQPFPPQRPVKAGHESRSFKIVVIVAVAWITEWAVHEALESPDRP
jgi:hypothetical protein